MGGVCGHLQWRGDPRASGMEPKLELGFRLLRFKLVVQLQLPEPRFPQTSKETNNR